VHFTRYRYAPVFDETSFVRLQMYKILSFPIVDNFAPEGENLTYQTSSLCFCSMARHLVGIINFLWHWWSSSREKLLSCIKCCTLWYLQLYIWNAIAYFIRFSSRIGCSIWFAGIYDYTFYSRSRRPSSPEPFHEAFLRNSEDFPLHIMSYAILCSFALCSLDSTLGMSSLCMIPIASSLLPVSTSSRYSCSNS